MVAFEEDNFMSDRAVHEAAASVNRELIDLLSAPPERLKKFAPWIATVAFYKAIHLIEAMFAAQGVPHYDIDRGDRRSDYDDPRNGLLKMKPIYANLFDVFDTLRRLSFIARYSGCGVDVSSNRINSDIFEEPEKLKSTVESLLKNIKDETLRIIGNGY